MAWGVAGRECVCEGAGREGVPNGIGLPLLFGRPEIGADAVLRCPIGEGGGGGAIDMVKWRKGVEWERPAGSMPSPQLVFGGDQENPKRIKTIKTIKRSSGLQERRVML